MPTTGNHIARTLYLHALRAHYGTIALPIGSQEHQIALESVFQPLRLRKRAFAMDPEASTSQEHLAEEATSWPDLVEKQEDEDLSGQPIIARNGAEALQQSRMRRLLVLGGPGMGKTTLLKALLQQAISTALTNPDAPLPLFISLPDLGRSGLPLLEYASAFLGQLEIEAAFANPLCAAIAQGQAFWCLDSLDEVLPAQRPDIVAELNRLAPQYGGTWIIGSRFTEYQGGQFARGCFSEWELLPLDERLRAQLADHLLPLLSHFFEQPLYQSEPFLRALAEDRQIAEWGSNPLLFSLAAVAYARQGQLPASRTALYATIIDSMLGLRIADAGERRALRAQLARLALDLYQSRGCNFSTQDLRELLLSYGYGDAADSLFASLTSILDSGVFDCVGDQTYAFKHQMFQEYLVAVALANQLQETDSEVAGYAWDFIRRKRTYSRWREILRLLVGALIQEHGAEGSSQAANWLQQLADAQRTEEGDPGHLCLVLALSSLQEFPAQAYPPTLEQAIRELLITWARKLFEALRAGGAIQAWNHQHRNSAISDARHVFARLQQVVGTIQTVELSLVIPALYELERLSAQDADLEEEEFDPDCVLVNNPLGSRFATFMEELVLSIPARVLDLVCASSSGRMNLETIITTKNMELPQEATRLSALLCDSGANWRERAGAARLLARCDAALACQTLSQVLLDTTCFYRVRVAAANALGWCGGEEAARVLTQAARDASERVRVAAVTAMGQLGDAMPVEVLLEALCDDKTREPANQALRLLSEQTSLEPFLQLCTDENSDLHLQVFGILQALQEKSARVPLAVLLQAMQGTDYEVRLSAIHMLGHGADARALPALLSVLHDPTPKPKPGEDLRSAAAKALLQISQSLPDLPVSVVTAHVEQALQEDFCAYYDLLELACTLRLPLSPAALTVCEKKYLSDLAESSSVYQPQKKVAYLTALGINTLPGTLLDMLNTAAPHVQKNAAQALRYLRHVPAESLQAWLEQELIFAAERTYSRDDAQAKTFVYLSECLARQGKPVNVKRLLSLLEQTRSMYGVAEDITQVFVLLDAQAPLAHLFGLLCDEIRPEMCIAVLSACYEALTPELLYAEASHRYQDEITALEMLGAMQNDAPIDVLMDILKDESRHKLVRVHALFTLHALGIAVPLEYFVLGQDWGIYGVENDMVESMTRLGAAAPIGELIQLLGYHNNWVNSGAIRSLHNLAEHVPVDLLSTALESSNSSMRENAALALSAFGERVPVQKLFSMLSDKRESPRVRAAGLGTLTHVGFSVPIALLLHLARLDNQRLRQAAFSAFVALGKQAPLDVLLSLLDEEELAHDAIETLGALAENAPVDFLLELFDDQELSVTKRHAAGRALARLGQYTSLDALLARLYAADGSVRTDVIDTFGGMGAYAPVAVLLQLLDNEEAREEADRALWQIEGNAPALLVAQARYDPRLVVRQHVLRALSKMGHDAPLEIVLEALEKKETRIDALVALDELGVDIASQIPKEKLLHIFSGEDEHGELTWREKAAIGQVSAPSPAAQLLSDVGAGSRSAAKELYQHYPTVFRESVLPQAEAILRGEPVAGIFSTLVQTRIATAVGQIGYATPEVLALLVDLLDWPHEETCLEAVRALGAIHRTIPDRAIHRLLELRREPRSSTMRKAADAALAEILSYEQALEEEA